MNPYSREFAFAQSRSSVCSLPLDDFLATELPRRIKQTLQDGYRFGTLVGSGYLLNGFATLYAGLYDKLNMTTTGADGVVHSYIQHGDWGRVVTGVLSIIISSIYLLSNRGHEPFHEHDFKSKAMSAATSPDKSISAFTASWNFISLAISGTKSFINGICGNRPEHIPAFLFVLASSISNYFFNIGYGSNKPQEPKTADKPTDDDQICFSESKSTLTTLGEKFVSREASAWLSMGAIMMGVIEGIRHMEESGKSMKTVLFGCVVQVILRIGLYINFLQLDKQHQQRAENSGLDR